MTLNKAYWENRYADQNLGWDIGEISTPLKEYIDQLADKEKRILVPGAGYGYEAAYLYQSGFKNTYVLDIAGQPLQELFKICPEFPKNQLLEQDFFKAVLSGFDLVIEQTFFCALDPELRQAYVQKMYDSLKKGGQLAGLLFDFPLTENGPPFGGSRDSYKTLFQPLFKIKKLERAYNSIEARQGNELFFIFEK
ncbi:MAG: methyltransferase domain-containing protein [Flavobacteriaceae bacterium]